MFQSVHRKGTAILSALVVAGAYCVMPAVAGASATASSYPERPVTIIVPVAPGGVTDVNARMLAELLGERLNQSFIVENRPGASGSIGAANVSRAKPDGHTLLFQYNAYHLITPQIVAATPWDPLKDFAPVANISSNPQVVVVHNDVPVKSLEELIEYGKEKRGELNYATAGAGSMHHLSAELLQQITGAEYTHIPFPGSGPAVSNLLGGVVDFALPGPSSVIPHIQSGNLRALGVTSSERLKSIPDVPTTVELGYEELVAYATSALYAPAGTPEPIIAKLAEAIEEVSAVESYVEKLEALGVAAQYMSPADLGAYDISEYERWGRVLKSANIQPE